MGVRSPSGSLYWKKLLGKMYAFVMIKDEDTLEVAPELPIWKKDPFIRLERR